MVNKFEFQGVCERMFEDCKTEEELKTRKDMVLKIVDKAYRMEIKTIRKFNGVYMSNK